MKAPIRRRRRVKSREELMKWLKEHDYHRDEACFRYRPRTGGDWALNFNMLSHAGEEIEGFKPPSADYWRSYTTGTGHSEIWLEDWLEPLTTERRGNRLVPADVADAEAIALVEARSPFAGARGWHEAKHPHETKKENEMKENEMKENEMKEAPSLISKEVRAIEEVVKSLRDAAERAERKLKPVLSGECEEVPRRGVPEDASPLEAALHDVASDVELVGDKLRWQIDRSRLHYPVNEGDAEREIEMKEPLTAAAQRLREAGRALTTLWKAWIRCFERFIAFNKLPAKEEPRGNDVEVDSKDSAFLSALMVERVALQEVLSGLNACLEASQL